MPLSRPIKLAVFATHPIQNQVPVWRELAKMPGIQLKVVYASDFSIKGYRDRQFGVNIKWDQPLLEGYESIILGHAQRGGFFSLNGKGISEALHDFKPDAGMICAYEPKFYVDSLRYLQRIGAVTLMRADLTDEDRSRTALKKKVRDIYARWVYRQIDYFCIVGEISKAHLERFDVRKDKIYKAGYNVDDNLFIAQRQAYSSRRDELREAMGIAPQDFVFLMPAKLIDKKKPDLLLFAYFALPEEIRKRVHVVFMGDGALKPILQEHLRKESVHNVHFTGFVNQADLGKYYIASDAVVLPSAYAETWGLVINEALLFGRPCLVSDKVGSRHDLVIEGKTGMIFKSGDTHELEQKMIKIESWVTADRSTITKNCLELGEAYSAINAAKGIAAAVQLTKS